VSIHALGSPIRIHVSQKYVEDARLLEYRFNRAYALVEWRGAFCEIKSSRILPETEAEKARNAMRKEI
jgi:hypothetical protein